MASTRNTTGSDSRFDIVRRGFRAVALSAIVCAAPMCANPAFAQKGKAVEEDKVEKSYTLPYFFSGLAVLMIVMPLCFPSLRKTEAPKEDDD
jgi:hypothetical protein